MLPTGNTPHSKLTCIDLQELPAPHMEKNPYKKPAVRQGLQQPLKHSGLKCFCVCCTASASASATSECRVPGDEPMRKMLEKNTHFPCVELESLVGFSKELRWFLLSFLLFALPGSRHAGLSTNTRLENQKNYKFESQLPSFSRETQ